MPVRGLVIAGTGVAFVRSPRYLAEKITDAVDARMGDVRDDAVFWRSVLRTWELRPSELANLQANVAQKYCRNLDIWSALPDLRRRYRVILAYSGPRTILDCWCGVYDLNDYFDGMVVATASALTSRDPALYRLIAANEGGRPCEFAVVESTAGGVEASTLAGMPAYRYGTAFGLGRWLEQIDRREDDDAAV